MHGAWVRPLGELSSCRTDDCREQKVHGSSTDVGWSSVSVPLMLCDPDLPAQSENYLRRCGECDFTGQLSHGSFHRIGFCDARKGCTKELP